MLTYVVEWHFTASYSEMANGSYWVLMYSASWAIKSSNILLTRSQIPLKVGLNAGSESQQFVINSLKKFGGFPIHLRIIIHQKLTKFHPGNASIFGVFLHSPNTFSLPDSSFPHMALGSGQKFPITTRQRPKHRFSRKTGKKVIGQIIFLRAT